MSHRAIQRLRREREAEILPTVDGSEEDDSDEDDASHTKKSNVFAAAMFDSDSDEDSDDSDVDSDGDSDDDDNNAEVDSSPSSKEKNDVGAARTEKANKPQKEGQDVGATPELHSAANSVGLKTIQRHSPR